MQEVEATTASPPPPRRVLLISAGGSHSVALISGNVVCSWGRGEDGQLGHGDTDDRLLPTQLSALDAQQIVSVVCGADHTLAYSESKVEVYSWGWGDFGRLGHGNSSDLFIPQPIRALQGLRIKQIACGDSHCLAVTMEGEVQSWGRNQNGQLGLGTTEDSLVPQKIQTFQGLPIKMVAAGAEHSVAITEKGELYGWGWGRYGNLGLGDRNDRCIPEKVSVDCDKMVLVACGWRHTISVSSSGELYTYGWSKYGQLGHGDCEDHLVPHKLQAFSDKLICQVSGGWRHTMALTTGGQLYGWGWNKFGQVGVGDNVDRCSPVQVKFPHDQKVAQISCGWRHTIAVTEKDNVYSWGRGTNGQLGIGDTIDWNSPKIIEALSVDGSCGQHIESSNTDHLSGKTLASLAERYAVVYKREYVCHRAGANKPTKVDEVESQRNRKSSRCNCNAKMFVSKTTIGIEEKWVVTYFNNSHNHELLDDKEVNFLPAYRDIPIPDQSRILLLSKAGCCIGLIMRILEAEKSISAGGLPFLERDIRNFIHDQSGIDKENDAADVLKLCKSLKDVDDAFQYDYTIDENRKLEHIIWAFGDSIRAYEAFGDVVLFDTTYRINRYEMPLGIWVGVDNHGNSIIFGCVLLRNEKIPSFTWALKNFLAFVKGKCPRTILTDQDPALKEAIAAELPNTKHAFCIWHIVAKLSSWFSSPLGERYNDFKYEFHKVYHLDSVDEFEQQWKLMVAQFDLSGDPHIKLLYSLRQCWALAYLKDFFFAGMTTTGRSESINSYIKHFLDAKTSLTDFVNKVGVAVQIRNHAGEEARMRQKYHNPRFRTSFPMEEHAASILTPYAFELIQLEIELSAKYAADETDSGSYMVKHHTKDGGGRTVTLIEGEKSILCSCKQFEFHGILCRHAIKVLMMKNYFQVPSKYLPFRWRRESSLVPKSSHMVNSDDSSSMEVRSLIQCLEYESLKTKERKQVATRGLEKLIREIKGMSESQENLTDLELGVPNNDDYDVENPILSKAKGRPKGSRPKGGVEAAKKVRRCHVPNCGGTNHDSRNCPNKRKNIEVLPTDSPYKATRGWRNRT